MPRRRPVGRASSSWLCPSRQHSVPTVIGSTASVPANPEQTRSAACAAAPVRTRHCIFLRRPTSENCYRRACACL
jgi:hypothetical protein